MYNFKIFNCCFVADLDDDNSGNELTHPSCHPRAKKIRLKNPTNLKKAKTPLEKNTKISSGERDEGRKTILIYFFKQSKYTVTKS